MAATEAIFASINPGVSNGAALSELLSDGIDKVVAGHLQSTAHRRVFYESLGKVFGRIKAAGKGGEINFDITSLKSALFAQAVEIEALRLVRADTILESTLRALLHCGITYSIRRTGFANV